MKPKTSIISLILLMFTLLGAPLSIAGAVGESGPKTPQREVIVRGESSFVDHRSETHHSRIVRVEFEAFDSKIRNDKGEIVESVLVDVRGIDGNGRQPNLLLPRGYFKGKNKIIVRESSWLAEQPTFSSMVIDLNTLQAELVMKRWAGYLRLPFQKPTFDLRVKFDCKEVLKQL